MNDDALFQAFSNPNCNRASKARFMVKYYTASGCLKPRAQTYRNGPSIRRTRTFEPAPGSGGERTQKKIQETKHALAPSPSPRTSRPAETTRARLCPLPAFVSVFGGAAAAAAEEEEMLSGDIPPNQTIYVKNLNEKVKKEGTALPGLQAPNSS